MAGKRKPEHPLVAKMKYLMILKGISDEELAAEICMTTRNFSNRKNKPETFDLKELITISRKLKMSITIDEKGNLIL